MKKIFFTLIVIAAAQIAVAQTKVKEDSLLKVMGDEVCDEMAKKDASEFTAENFQMKVGMMFLGTFQKHNDELTELYGEGFLVNQDKLREVGEKIGFNMGIGCKAFQDIIMKNEDIVKGAMNMDSKIESPKKKIPVSIEKVEVKSMDGKVLSYTPADISFYTINVNGQQKKLYWLQKFEGDDELIANPKTNIRKKVSFGYTEVKVYNTVSKTYKTINVITSYLIL